jgi:hypothetical protein
MCCAAVGAAAPAAAANLSALLRVDEAEALPPAQHAVSALAIPSHIRPRLSWLSQVLWAALQPYCCAASAEASACDDACGEHAAPRRQLIATIQSYASAPAGCSSRETLQQQLTKARALTLSVCGIGMSCSQSALPVLPACLLLLGVSYLCRIPRAVCVPPPLVDVPSTLDVSLRSLAALMQQFTADFEALHRRVREVEAARRGMQHT